MQVEVSLHDNALAETTYHRPVISAQQTSAHPAPIAAILLRSHAAGEAVASGS